VFVLDEIYLKGGTTDDLIDAIKDKFNITGQIFYCDSAEPDRILDMKKSGIIAYPVKKGSGSVDFSLDWLKSRYIILHPSCQNTIREIKNYRYQKDKSGNLTTKLPKENDDTISALRYAILNFARTHKTKFTPDNSDTYITKTDQKVINTLLVNDDMLELNILSDY
jgi:phage terminase large subunit